MLAEWKQHNSQSENPPQPPVRERPPYPGLILDYNTLVVVLEPERIFIAPTILEPFLPLVKTRNCFRRLRRLIPDRSKPKIEDVPHPDEVASACGELVAIATDLCKEIVAALDGASSTEDGEEGTETPTPTPEELNVEARRYLEANRHREFTNKRLSIRELLAHLRTACGPCSLGTVQKLPIWTALMEQRRKRQKPKEPKIVSLTDKMQQAAVPVEDEGDKDQLHRLIAEQQADKMSEELGRPQRVRISAGRVTRKRLEGDD